MITFKQTGDFSHLTNFLERVKGVFDASKLDKYGKRGVSALSRATPESTGLLASSWYYTIENEKGRIRLRFCNSDIENGLPIAIIVQYGHGTKNGGWVEGRDYINPAIQPIFDEIVEDMWREVTSK